MFVTNKTEYFRYVVNRIFVGHRRTRSETGTTQQLFSVPDIQSNKKTLRNESFLTNDDAFPNLFFDLATLPSWSQQLTKDFYMHWKSGNFPINYFACKDKSGNPLYMQYF